MIDCLSASHDLLLEMHRLQNLSVLGIGVCPAGAVLSWLDHMEPAPLFPLCVRSSHNHLDSEVRGRGRWSECVQFAAILEMTGAFRCRVLDIGANIGACSVMLAHLGYQVVAFEPLARNLELFRAS